MVQQSLQEAGEVCVEAFVPRDQFVGEAQPRHETSLLEPEYGTESATEEYPFHGSEGHQPFGKRHITRHPVQSPFRLFLDDRKSVNGMEQFRLGSIVFYESVNKKRIGFGVYVLHSCLKPLEGSSLWHLDIYGESRC